MQVQIDVVADDNGSGQLMSLWQWLNDEDEFRGLARREASLPPPGVMGGAADVLTVAVAGGGALTVLIGSVRTWLQSRRSTLTVNVRGPNSRSMEITATGPAADVIAGLLVEGSDPGSASVDTG